MKPAAFEYHSPETIEECVELLEKFGDDAVVVSGGQSIVPLMRFRMAQPEQVVSLRRLKSLASVEPTGSGIKIGARVTYNAAINSDLVKEYIPGVSEVIGLIATPVIRSRGTLCGNLCQADAASELPAFSLIMDARFHLVSKAGKRIVEASDFFLGGYITARQSDELLTHVEFPRREKSEAVVTREVSRLAGGFPMAGITLALMRGENSKIHKAAIACFGNNPVQMRLPDAEAALVSEGSGKEAIDRAADSILNVIDPHSDVFASVAYKRALTRTLFKDAVQVALERGSVT